MDTLQNVEVAWSAAYQEGLDKFGDYTQAFPEITEVYESRELTTNLALVLGEPIVREWKDNETRIVDHFSSTSYDVGIRDWALTIGMHKRYLDYDKLGVTMKRFERLPLAIPRHYESLVFQTLIAGFATNCWDGQFFFDTDHPYFRDEVTTTQYSNFLNQALSTVSFEAARRRLRSIARQSSNDALNPCSDLRLIVGPDLDELAHEIVAPNKNPSGYNRNANAAKVEVVNGLMPYPGYWFLWDATLGLKPVFLKVNKRMDEMVIFNKPTDPGVFHRKMVIAGADGEHEVAYLHPMNIIGCHP